MRINEWQVFFSFVVGILVSILGGWDSLVFALTALMVLDYVTGVAAAAYLKKVSSKIGFKGIIKKFIILSLVALAVILDKALNTDQFWRTAAIFFFSINEAISIIENAEKCDVRVPKAMKEMLLKEKEKQEGDTDANSNTTDNQPKQTA